MADPRDVNKGRSDLRGYAGYNVHPGFVCSRWGATPSPPHDSPARRWTEQSPVSLDAVPRM